MARCHIAAAKDVFYEILSHSSNGEMFTDSVSDTGAVTLPILTSEYKQPCGRCAKYLKLVFEVTKTYKIGLNGPLQLIITLYAVYTRLYTYKT